MVAIISSLYLTLFLTILNYTTRVSFKLIGFGFLYWFFLVCTFYLNVTLNIIEEKYASFNSYDMYLGELSSSTFFVQYILAYPAFSLFNFEYSAHAINISLQTVFFVLLIYMSKAKRIRIAYFGLLFYPSFIHYSITGLRDPILNFISLSVVLGILNLNKQAFVILCILLAVLCNFVRPEYSLIVLGFALLRLYVEAGRWQKLFIISLGVVLLYMALLILPLAFGVPASNNVFTNIDTMIRFNEMRTERTSGTASTGILNGALMSMPIFIALSNPSYRIVCYPVTG